MNRISRSTLHWALRSIAIVAALGIAAMDLSGRESGSGEALGCIGCVDGPVGQDNCCDECHTTITGGSGYGGTDHSMPCYPNTCENTHDPCEATLDELPELSQLDLVDTVHAAVDTQDAHALARFLRAAPRRITLNDARQAIQLVDCSGDVIANFPTPSQVLSSIEALDALQQ